MLCMSSTAIQCNIKTRDLFRYTPATNANIRNRNIIPPPSTNFVIGSIFNI